jgi:hypothetical protein
VIREERDPTFWNAICEHPEVKPHVTLGHELDLSEVVTNPTVTPLASEHGGFIFIRLDGLGRVYELHTMYTPEGWGREVASAAKQAFSRIFSAGADLVVTHEVRGNRRSQPPLSFRFAPASAFHHVPQLAAELRTWVLTRSAWEVSPARQRMPQCQ